MISLLMISLLMISLLKECSFLDDNTVYSCTNDFKDIKYDMETYEDG